MRLEDWLPIYRDILTSFGYNEDEDRRAAVILDGLMEKHDIAGTDLLRKLLEGERVLVIGPARIEKFNPEGFNTVVVADSGMENAEALGMTVDIIVTDLDAPPGVLKMEFNTNKNGAILIIHAHGDNIPALEKYLPKIEGAVMGTTQAVPFGRVHNFGGFTDGDRAVTMAAHFGAREIALIGFDLENPVPKPGHGMETKRKKLGWAERIIGMANPQPYILPRD